MAFSKLRFSELTQKNCLQVSFGEQMSLKLTQILNFKSSCCNIKIRRLGKILCEGFYASFLRNFIWNNILSRFSCEKILLNIANDRKGISKFPHTVLWSFIITTRIWDLSLGLAEVETG